ncbi:MAG: hypothetical protein HRT45_10455 [Bdellovibrionales bacterium]|nr:hypothetical protein [Bdellovibrionales bacterium]
MANRTSLAKFLVLIIAVAVMPACQKAKMKTVERNDSDGFRGERFVPDPDRDRDDDRPPVVRDDDRPPFQPPIDQPDRPLVTNGEGGDPAGRPPTGLIPGSFEPTFIPTTPAPQTHRVIEQRRVPQPDTGDFPITAVTWPRGGRTLTDLDECYSEACVQPPVIDPTPEDPVVQPPSEHQCRPIDQPATPITNKLDVLFVADTSDSIDSEKSSIARNIHRFVDELNQISNVAGYNQQIDFRMAVLLAHGPNTKTEDKRGFRTHGNLFIHRSEPEGAKAVLGGIGRSSEHLDYIKQTLELRFNGGLDTFDPSCSIDEPGAEKQCIRDTSDTLGEAGLLALEKWLAVYKDHNHQQNASSPDQVFPRRDAALMIVFVSDENDVCFDYNRWNSEPVRNRERAYPFSQYNWNIENDYWNFSNQPAPSGAFVSGLSGHQNHTRAVEYPVGSAVVRDIYEHRAFVNPEECGGPSRNEHIHLSVASLLENAKQWQIDRTQNRMPIIASGILLRTKQEADSAAARVNQLFRETGDEAYKWFRDKERGWGYINLIHAFHGTAASLNSTDFGGELAEIGKDATFVLTYQTELELIDTTTGQPLDLSSVAPGSLRVESVNREFINADGSRKANAEVIHLNAQSHFRLIYDTETTGHLRLDRQGIKDAGVKPGSKMYIFYRRR